MVSAIAYFRIFNFPVIAYLGILTLLMLLLTASVQILNKRGIHWLRLKWHHIFAYITITLALIHGLLGTLSYWF